MITGKQVDTLFHLNVEVQINEAYVAKSGLPTWLDWHKCFSHIGVTGLWYIHQHNPVEGLSKLLMNIQFSMIAKLVSKQNNLKLLFHIPCSRQLLMLENLLCIPTYGDQHISQLWMVHDTVTWSLLMIILIIVLSSFWNINQTHLKWLRNTLLLSRDNLVLLWKLCTYPNG